MENGFFIEKLAAIFGQNASVKNVYGEPVKSGDKTIIPVAEIAYGLGGGYGPKKNKHVQSDESSGNEGRSAGEGIGGGGGMYAKPKGVYEVTSTYTRFIPANSKRQLIAGLAIGFLLKGWLHSRKKKRIKQAL